MGIVQQKYIHWKIVKHAKWFPHVTTFMLVNLVTKRMTSNCGCKPEHQYFKAHLCRGFFTVCAPSKHSPRVSKADISNISPSSEWKEGSDLSKGWHSKLHALSTTANLHYQPPPLPNNAAPQFLQKLTTFYQFKTLSLKSFKAVYFYLTKQVLQDFF